MTHLMPINWDRHLDDDLTPADYRAKREREQRVAEKTKEILDSIEDIESLLTENPHTIAMYMRPVMGENYLDYVQELRTCIRGLAAEVADDEVGDWRAFRERD